MSEQHCRRVVNMEKVSGEFKQTYLYPPRCCRKMVKRQGCFDDREISIPTLCCIWICSCIFLSEGPRHFPNMSPILMRTNWWQKEGQFRSWQCGWMDIRISSLWTKTRLLCVFLVQGSIIAPTLYWIWCLKQEEVDNFGEDDLLYYSDQVFSHTSQPTKSPLLKFAINRKWIFRPSRRPKLPTNMD
jgi:hypothetical protein